MRTPLAVVFGALLIGASIIGAQFMDRYEIASGTDTIVWRVNARTGAIDLCSFEESSNPFDKLDSSQAPTANAKAFQIVCRRSLSKP
jgi:hypothetical protein